MTQYYLAYNARCPTCVQLAGIIHDAIGNKLIPIGLDSDLAKQLLDQAYPNGWAFAPHLISVKADRVRAWTGFQLMIQLGCLLGYRQTRRVLTVARQLRVPIVAPSFMMIALLSMLTAGRVGSRWTSSVMKCDPCANPGCGQCVACVNPCGLYCC